MAEVILEFDNLVVGPDHRVYTARVCGRETETGRWEGWIEFDDRGAVRTVRTSRETTQPHRKDLAYWATGLTAAYIEGALERALDPEGPVVPAAVPPPASHFEGPAPHRRGRTDAAAATAAQRHEEPHPILDPFAVHQQGNDLLRDELHALGAGHLRTIIRAYHLANLRDAELDSTPHAALVELIVNAVRAASD
jgi:hypothetical protein